MSLINQMLKELENRKQSISDEQLILSELSSASTYSELWFSKLNFVYLFVFLSVILFLYITHRYVSHKHHHIMPIVASPSSLPAMPKMEMTPTAIVAKANIDRLSFANHDVLLQFSSHFNAPVTYDVATLPGQIKLTLHRVDLSSLCSEPDNCLTNLLNGENNNAIPVNFTLPSDDNPNLELIFEIGQAYTLQSVDYAESNDQLDLIFQPNDADKSAADIKRNSAPPSAKQLFEEALTLSASGDIDGSVEQLTSALTLQPTYREARLELIKLLVQQKKIDDALSVADRGLYLQNEDEELRLVKARILVNEQQAQKALALLQDYSPPFAHHLNYYAFLAAVLTETNNLSAAKNWYLRLVDADGEQAAWWVGLGITQEGEHENAAASHSYQMALKAYQQTPALQHYAEQRIEVLGGSID